jgi:hypothetical protein
MAFAKSADAQGLIAVRVGHRRVNCAILEFRQWGKRIECSRTWTFNRPLFKSSAMPGQLLLWSRDMARFELQWLCASAFLRPHEFWQF